MPGHDLFVLGASAGGVETLRKLVEELTADLPASLLVVLHIAPHSPGYLPAILDRVGNLPALMAKDGMPIEQGHIYVAPPDFHLLVEDSVTRVLHGPKENRHRPAIDPLFRSAAWAYGPRTVGVILSGTLDDGAAGLWAVKSCGGVAIVQDPSDAIYSEMPNNALQAVDVDYQVTLAQMPALFERLALEPVAVAGKASGPAKVQLETEFAMMKRDLEDMKQLGQPSVFTCPACRGALWEVHDDSLVRYRCHVGHAYSSESLWAEQSEAMEAALFQALRAIEEKLATARRIAEKQRIPKHLANFEKRIAELERSAETLRKMLLPRS